jgi:hypothetical protein
VIDSRDSSLSATLLAAVLAAACAAPSAAPPSALQPLPTAAAYVPDATDLALRDIGRALLASDPAGVDAAVARVEALERERPEGANATGALPFALDARHSFVSDPALYRALSAHLLERDDLPPELRARLAQEVEDDPLALAEARIREARTRRFARAFNALAESAGRSLTNTAVLAYRVAAALIDVAVVEHMEDELPLEERQALRHWKQFLEQHPGAPEAPAVLARVESAQRRWYRTQRDRTVHAAERALESGDARLGLALAERALRYAPEDEGAGELFAEAQAETEAIRTALTRSEGADLRGDATSPAARALALALLASAPPALPPEAPDAPPAPGAVAAGPAPSRGPGAVVSAAEPLASDGTPHARDEARFTLAVAAGERGDAGAMWETLGDLAGASDARSNMARHARAVVLSPQQNPWLYWKRARRAETSDKARFLLLGPLAGGARDRKLPRAAEWALEIPALVPVVVGLPQRLIRLPWIRDGRRSPAVFARRLLERQPDDERAENVRRWLVRHEERRGNAVAALAAAEGAREPDQKRIAKLREKAAAQGLELAKGQADLPTRVALLRRVGREYAGTEPAVEAVEELRRTLRDATAQEIRVSRGFLSENPEVAGPQGLALRPELLDGDAGNGELHPDGVTLLGGREVEIAYLGEGGDPRDEPLRRRERMSEERLQRAVAALDEAALRNALVDPDYPIEYDADRDLFFERARLGLAESAHPSAEARSSYAFRGLRERYGLVRPRESILPVELVVQGSLRDLGLGAFPRIRMPRRTRDAFLYQ